MYWFVGILLFVQNIIFLITSVNAAGMAFLKIDVSAKPAGMGSAYVAVADGITGIWNNPASISKITTEEFIITHQEWLQDINYEALAYAYPAGKLSLGICVNYLYTDDIPEILRYPTGEPDITGRMFTASDISGMLVITNQLTSKSAVGIGVKYIQENIDNKSAAGIAGDIGMVYMPSSKIQLGIAVQNIGSNMQFDKYEFALPLMYRIGIAWQTHAGLISIEFNKAKDRAPIGAVGMEVKINNSITARCGYSFLKHREGYGKFKGISTGMSLGFGIKINQTYIDYAFVPYGVLEDTHRVSVSVKFGHVRHRKIRWDDTLQRYTTTTQDKQKYIKRDVLPHDVVIVTNDNVAIREGPGTDYPVIFRVDKGTELKVINKDLKWYYEVLLPDGGKGWICAIFVSR
jgi:hypothetical protein